MDKKERLNKLVRYIIWTFDVPFQSAIKTIATEAGINPSNLSTALRGNETYLTDSLIKKVNRAYKSPFFEQWLMFGTGEMLTEGNTAVITDPTVIIYSQQDTIQKLSDSLATLSTLFKQQI